MRLFLHLAIGALGEEKESTSQTGDPSRGGSGSLCAIQFFKVFQHGLNKYLEGNFSHTKRNHQSVSPGKDVSLEDFPSSAVSVTQNFWISHHFLSQLS